MDNLRNKSNRLKHKNYLNRFNQLNVYSYTKPDDKKLYIGCKPSEVYFLFNGNTSTEKKTLPKSQGNIIPEDITFDQSSLQYYIILALQDFYQNYYVPLADENKSLKNQLEMTQTLISGMKKKNDDRFDILTKNLQSLAQHMNEIKKN